MAAETIDFRPARPPLRSLWPMAVLAPIFFVMSSKILAKPEAWSLVGLCGVAVLIIGGTWLWFRGRFPGDPTLRVDAKGMSYTRGGRERRLDWTQGAAIQIDFTLDRMLFIPVSGEKPIVMHRNMFAADGRPWAMLIEEYWHPPQSG